jgi:hypothetical protein
MAIPPRFLAWFGADAARRGAAATARHFNPIDH